MTVVLEHKHGGCRGRFLRYTGHPRWDDCLSLDHEGSRKTLGELLYGEGLRAASFYRLSRSGR